jgi:hypothetical protein
MIAWSCTIRQTMHMMVDFSSDLLCRHHSLLPPLLIWAPSFLFTFHIIYFIFLSTIVVQSFHFCLGSTFIYKRKEHFELNSWQPRHAALIGPSYYVLRGWSLAGIIDDVFKTRQLVSMWLVVRKETFIKVKLCGVQGVDVYKILLSWWSWFLTLSFYHEMF